MFDNERGIFDFIDPAKNDKFSFMKGNDLYELFVLLDNYYLEYREKLGFRDYVTFGMELEFEDAKMDLIKRKLAELYLNGEWNLTSEISVMDNDGAEVISPICSDNKITWNDLNMVCNMLKENAYIGENSGGHIHIGTQVIGDNPRAWLNFIKLWSVYENIIFRFGYGEFLSARSNIDIFADSIGKSLWKVYKRFSKSKFVTTSDIIKDMNCNRCTAVELSKVSNFDYFEPFNTIEFRFPNGSLEPVIWQNNINLIVNILEYVKKSSFDDDIINKRYFLNKGKVCSLEDYDYIYLKQALELCDMVFDTNLDKIYFLRQYLKSFQVSKGEFVRAKTFVRK